MIINRYSTAAIFSILCICSNFSKAEEIKDMYLKIDSQRQTCMLLETGSEIKKDIITLSGKSAYKDVDSCTLAIPKSVFLSKFRFCALSEVATFGKQNYTNCAVRSVGKGIPEFPDEIEFTNDFPGGHGSCGWVCLTR